MKKKGNLSTTHYLSALILERYLDIIFHLRGCPQELLGPTPGEKQYLSAWRVR